MKRSYIYKLTDDDWYKNHFGNKVKLMYHGDITPCNVETHRYQFLVMVISEWCLIPVF